MGQLQHADGIISITNDSDSITLPFADFQLVEPNYHYPELTQPVVGCRYESGKSSALITTTEEVIYPFEEQCEFCFSQVETYKERYKELIKTRFTNFRVAFLSPPNLQHFEEVFNALSASSPTLHSILFDAWSKVADTSSFNLAVHLWNQWVPGLGISEDAIAAFNSVILRFKLSIILNESGGIDVI